MEALQQARKNNEHLKPTHATVGKAPSTPNDTHGEEEVQPHPQEAAAALEDASSVAPKPNKLDLRHNSISANGAEAIAQALLKSTTSGTHLDRSWNSIGDKGVTAIEEALHSNTPITHLDLSYNSIGDEGGKAIAEALKHNTSVTHLYLSHNEIHDYGAKALAEALKDNASVTHLTLKSNNIGDEGGKALLSCLKVNMTIKQLHCFSATLSKSSAFAHLLATTHHKRPDVNVSFSR